MDRMIIPNTNKKAVMLPKTIAIQGLVYIGISGKDRKPNNTLEIGEGALFRSGTVIYLGSTIGESLQTGHNAIIRENNIIGDNVVVGVNSYLGPGNRVGNNVRIHTAVFLESTTIEDDVIISPGVIFTNDPYPPCKDCVELVGGAYVEEGTVIGANATIFPGIRIGKKAFIGAGSVVTKDVPQGMVVVGNPARVVKKRSELRHSHENGADKKNSYSR